MEQKQLIELVKKIRIETGLGIMEIKSAVEEADGSAKQTEQIETVAKQILKEKGFKKAEKKSERATGQGRVATYTHSTGKVGVMVELLCETDFVAKNEEFLAVAKDLCLQVAAMNPETVDDLMKQEFIKDSSRTMDDIVKALIAKFGENIKVGRMARFEIEAVAPAC